MKLSRKQLRNMISNAHLNESSYEDAKRLRRREYEMQDPGYYPGNNNHTGVTLPEPDLRGSTIEYPGGKKAFLQSMIDKYKRVGMHEEAGMIQAKLDAMTDDIFKGTLKESRYKLNEGIHLGDIMDPDNKFYSLSADTQVGLLNIGDMMEAAASRAFELDAVGNPVLLNFYKMALKRKEEMNAVRDFLDIMEFTNQDLTLVEFLQMKGL